MFIDKAKDLHESQDLYSEVMSARESIKAMAPKKKRRKTQIWMDFEESYKWDLQVLSLFSCSACTSFGITPFRSINLKKKGNVK